MSESKENIQSWPDLAIGLYEKLTGKGAVISYEFEDFNLGVPREVGSSDVTTWKINGKLKISTSEK
ncbi:hypothetical protein A33Q_0152 [Indibacter alkaliphilus LW1]|jgi:hypothetical protein|uniref:Uncharacterized protein n=1 Tax=Indibacter alkaliphilus (strain CCUG 57479 / KCTC 22604 / LW1) TaxID=1189612 RepID=S2DSL8_INDAL|nr:hypothetical protein [Indibacter alkaliphilus]EPA00281.1 hypothetical protein A33Q_0152 [Indibacter alkaliphilus LW1]